MPQLSSQIKLKREIPSAPTHESLNLNQDYKITTTTSSFYQNGAASLFHGLTFQGVKSVLNITLDKITIECYLPAPGEKQQGQFPVQTFNPYVADVQTQSKHLIPTLQMCKFMHFGFGHSIFIR